MRVTVLYKSHIYYLHVCYAVTLSPRIRTEFAQALDVCPLQDGFCTLDGWCGSGASAQYHPSSIPFTTPMSNKRQVIFSCHAQSSYLGQAVLSAIWSNIAKVADRECVAPFRSSHALNLYIMHYII